MKDLFMKFEFYVLDYFFLNAVLTQCFVKQKMSFLDTVLSLDEYHNNNIFFLCTESKYF